MSRDDEIRAEILRETREYLALEATELDQIEREMGYRLARAAMLAPTIEICEALLAGESVPLDRLDPYWVRRYGLRAAA